MKKLQLNRKALERGCHLIVGKFELYLSIDGYYCINNVKTRHVFHYSNYALMRRCLTELLN
jgi:hypothetical protein